MIHSQQHAIRLTAKQAADRIAAHASPMAKALHNFLLPLGQSRAKTVRELPIFEVRYPYGAQVTGDRSGEDKFSKVLSPCLSNPCASCQQLLTSFPNHRPLIFVLEGSCEEYIQYKQFQPVESRRAPLRFYSKGEMVGLNRLLNQLYLPAKPVRPIFGHSARRISAGSRSIFFSASLSNPQLMKHIQKKDTALPELQAWLAEKLEYISPRDLGRVLEREHWRFFKIMADAAIRRDASQGWQCRLLLIPVEPLAQLLRNQESTTEVQEFLLAVFSDFFVAVRNSRSDFLRQMVIFNKLAAQTGLTPYVKSTVHYLIELIRGEFPAFVPHNPAWGDDFGPASAVYRYMEEIGVPQFLKDFPGLLRPAHLNPAIPQNIYYSFERPTLLAPIGEDRSVRSIAEKVYSGLTKIEAAIPELFDSMKWEIFVSGGKSKGPPLTKRSARGTEKIQFMTYQEDHRIRSDFASQIEANRQNGWSDLAGRDFHRAQGGFMASFVRISPPTKEKEGAAQQKNLI